MTRAACTILFLALLTPAAHATETADVAIPPALAEALAEVEPAALDELVRTAKARAAQKAEAEKAALAAKANEAKKAAEEAAAALAVAEAAEALAEAEATGTPAALDAPDPSANERPGSANASAASSDSVPAPTPDPKLAAVLAELDGTPRPRVDSPTPATPASVNPLARALSAFLFALVLGGFLFLHPRTRAVLLSRLSGKAAPSLDDEGFVVRSRKSLGTGQALVDLELDGVRLLVGLSPGRIDLLHSWGAEPALADAVQTAPRRALVPEPVAARPAPPQEPPAPPRPAPSVDQLLEAWKGTVETETSPPEPADPEGEAPWWLEGASRLEKRRIEAQASDGVAESVLASLHNIRGRDVALADRTGAGTTPPRPVPPPAADLPEDRPTVMQRSKGRALGTFALVGAVLVPALLGADLAMAEELSSSPALSVSLDGAGGAGTSTAVKLLITLTMMAIAPAVVLSMTSFTRLIVVFSLLRQAVGVQQAPPNQVLVGLALFLTWFVMGPTFERVNEVAVAPYTAGELTEGEALTAGMGPMRDFMMANTREPDLALFLRMSNAPRPQTRADVPTNALVPAFLISELKTAFQIGFLIYIPFLIIDVVVSTVLLAMGMMVLPPVVISLPFKLLLFVFVDGWNLLVSSMVQSFA